MGLEKSDASLEDETSPLAKTILLVEDDVLIRISIADDLMDAGYNVIQSSHADEAIRTLERCPVDLVITDINMPHGSMNGLELADQIRKTWSSVKIIILSSHVTLERQYESADICIAKPHGMIKIVEYVQSAAIRCWPTSGRANAALYWRQPSAI